MNETTNPEETDSSSSAIGNVAVFLLSFMLGAMCVIGVPETATGVYEFLDIANIDTVGTGKMPFE